MEVFNLSLHRSATTSSAQVFRDSAFTVMDWVGWEFEHKNSELFKRGSENALMSAIMAEYSHCNYYGDNPIPYLAEELLNANPSGLFFIVLRDLDSWAKSSYLHCLHTTKKESGTPMPNELSPANRLMLDKYGLLEQALSLIEASAEPEMAFPIWRQLYYQHLISMARLFMERKKKLHILYLADPTIGQKLMQLANPCVDASQFTGYTLAHHHSNDRGQLAID